MSNFKAGAWRAANDGARPKTLTAADDLVRRTLAQHGLWPENDAPSGNAPRSGLMEGLMQGLDRLPSAQGMRPKSPLTPRPPSPPPDLLDGAAFRSETHAGHSGSRNYRHFVPASASKAANEGVAGIVVMLHGCTQTPEDFALGTGMNALAEAHRLVVIYPEQARGANAQTCWNWFSKADQRRERGEPEILAGIARKAMAEHGVPPERTFVAGLSAGAAMAVILGETYPDVFAAVGVHSGLPFGAAHDVPSAFAAMAGDLQHAKDLPPRTRRSIIFHGTMDRTVVSANGSEIARRAGYGDGTQTVETSETGQAGGRGFKRTRTSDAAGQVLVDHWLVDGLGHAWSGGSGKGSYADPAGPDASAEMIRFFLDLPAEDAR